jgi:AAA15 family ATPase/GTPase
VKQKFIVKGTRQDSFIAVEPFSLNSQGAKLPSKFIFELLINETIYEYSFVVTRKSVLEEKLIEITSTKEKVIYDRRENKPHFHDSLENDQFLHFAFRGTRDNQLFLTNAVSQKVTNFKHIYDWFSNNLELIAPDSRFGPFHQFIDEKNPLYKIMNKVLYQLDTGISSLGSEKIAIENAPFPDEVKKQLSEDISDKNMACIRSVHPNMLFVVTSKDGELKINKLITNHHKDDGTNVKFEMFQESDGSQRIIDILPVFLKLSEHNSKKVFVIDELDRSLHTLLTRRLLELYLATCSPNSRAQLLVTTHDVLLMDQQLLRRDEMWIAERDRNGASKLLAFSEYKDVRYDKDIRKSYLQGRLGGIPRILLSGPLSNQHSRKSVEETVNVT